jgi:hypothetical protein
MSLAVQTLVTDIRYQGQYVALQSFTDNTVIASGLDPVLIMDEVRSGGNEDAVLVFVPQENETVHVF